MSIRGGLLAESKARESTLRAVKHHADGRVEDLGVIAYWHKNPLKRWAWKARQFARRIQEKLS